MPAFFVFTIRYPLSAIRYPLSAIHFLSGWQVARWTCRS
jgi:hypothetical protein